MDNKNDRNIGEPLFKELLKKTVEAGASDIHLKTGLPPVVRHNDNLRLLSRSYPPLSGQEIASICEAILPDFLRPAYEDRKEVDMAYSLAGVGRFRLNIFRHRGQVGIICRFIPFEIKSLAELGLPKILQKLSLMPRGLILLTGTAGAGKSSTMAAMLNEWNTTQGGHIITIEDPVEFLIRDKKAIITQREIGIDTDSFDTGLKYALRQDPDVIMIGELRDRNTIQTALNAAETGHLVLSTLHTKDAIETINRLVGVFASEAHAQMRVQIANVLTAVVSQRLIPRIADASGKDMGSVVAAEVLINTGRVRDCLLDEKKTEQLRETMEQGAQEGMQTFDQALMSLYQKNLISRESALQNATRPNDFELRLRGIQTSAESWSTSK